MNDAQQVFCRRLFLLVWVLTFLLINLGFYYCLDFVFHFSGVAYALFLEFLAFGLAWEAAIMILSFSLREGRLPCLRELNTCPRVALICCTCDDVEANSLKKLGTLSYPNLDVFILDDSQHVKSKLVVDSLPFRVVRRADRKGYKAGNLNNWLSRYGSNYEYFVVADADSVFPCNFVQEMLCYAEHTENSRIAVFETTIHACNLDNEFVRLQNVMTRVINRLKLRAENWCGLTLSVGHNNLYRMKSIIENGGFSEEYIAEDYATSIALLKSNHWELKTVPVASFERVPSNLSEYARRQARWAFQTLQLQSLDISGIPPVVKLKIIRSLHYYLESIVVPIAVAWMVWIMLMCSPLLNSSQGILQHPYYSKIILFWVFYLVVPLGMRLLLALLEKVSCVDFLKSTLLHLALFVSTIWPIVKRLIWSWVYRHSAFNVTGQSQSPSLLRILRIGGPGFILFSVAFFLAIHNPILAGLNFVWILPSSFSPFILYYVQSRKR